MRDGEPCKINLETSAVQSYLDDTMSRNSALKDETPGASWRADDDRGSAGACCRPKWHLSKSTLSHFMRSLQAALPTRSRHKISKTPDTTCWFAEVGERGTYNSTSEDVAPLMPLSSGTEAFWGMRPPSEDGDEESKSDDDVQAEFDSIDGAGTDLPAFSAPTRENTRRSRGFDICKLAADVSLPGFGLHCRDCISMKIADMGELEHAVSMDEEATAHETLRLLAKKTPGTPGTASNLDLEIFGIERQFEIGSGPAWVRSLAEDQPERTVFFPPPPEHAGTRLFHSGPHAWRKSPLRKLSQLRLAERRSRSCPAKALPEKSRLRMEGSSMHLPEVVVL